MLKRHLEKRLLCPEDVASSADALEVIGTFNPGAADTEEGVKLLVRVAERPRQQRVGFTPLPRWQGGYVVVDWIPRTAAANIYFSSACSQKPRWSIGRSPRPMHRCRRTIVA